MIFEGELIIPGQMVRRILYGYRDDLRLSERWWHRLLFVVCVIGMIVVAWTSLAIVADIESNAAQTVEVKDTYVDYVKRNATDDRPIILISAYVGVTDFEGFATTSHCDTPREKEKPLYTFTEGADSSFCTKPELVSQAIAEVKRLFGTDAKVSTGELLGSSLNKERGVICITDNRFPDCDLESIKTTHIVKNQINGAAKARVLGWTLLAVTLASLSVANLYHRVFLYVIFGRRKKLDLPSAA